MASLSHTSRVKFMDDLEGHFCYLDFLLKSNNAGVAHAVSEDQGKQNICRERKIFVKAALQLLDAQEKNVVNSLIVPSLVGAETTDFDIIRSGYLKKGARVSKMIPNMGLSQSKSSYTWKSKYVELRHGEFSYYDDTVEETPLATASLHSYHSQSHSKATQHAGAGGGGGPSTAGPVAAPTGFKKSIPLSPDLCSCRVVQYASGRGGAHYQAAAHQQSERDDSEAEDTREAVGSGIPATPSDGNFVPGHAFEICLLGGQRRLFLTGSAEESREWVRDIMTAMVGGKAATLELPQDRKMSAPAVPAPELPLKSAGQTARSKMQEGGAGPYAGSITEYLNLQARLHSVREEEGYKAIMRELVDRRARVAVPVAYIKGKCSDNSFSGAATHLHVPASSSHHEGHTPLSLSINALLSGKHRQHHHTGNGKSKTVPPIPAAHLGKNAVAAVCVERSQMWKDLQRDEVCVNGECVAGASADGSFPGDASSPAAEASQGAEAIVGLLVRHIADAVDRAKAELQGILVRSQPHTPHASHHVLLQIMTEAQIVQCARSVLMMCNRTQSGGDTYYCVDTLLRRKSAPAADGNGPGGGGYNSDNLFILAPMSNKAEPLTIEVDLVETDRSGFDPEGGGSRLQIQQKAEAAAAFATPTAAAGRNGSLFAEPSPRTDFIDALAATSLGNNGQSSPAVQRTLTTDTTDDGLKRRSSRRLHLKLSIDEDTDYYDRERASSFSLYADAATPIAAINSKGLRSEFVSILEENSSHNSDTTDDRNQPPHRRGGGESNVTVSLSSSSKGGSEEEHRGGRAALRLQHPNDAPPLRVLSIDEGALHDEGGDGDVSNNNTPPYLISTRDDSTVISDITFDTTAAFSQHTTVASYHQQTKDVPLGCASDAEVAEVTSPPRPGKKSGHHLKGGKALMKMISARLPTKHMGMSFTPGGHAHNFSDHDLSAAASAASHVDEQQQGQAPVHGELRPSQSSYGSLQTLTPSSSRGGSNTPGVEHSNGGGGGGNMLSSLFKSERSKAAKAGHAQNHHQDAVQEKDRKVSEKEASERVVERKACVCVRLRVRGVSRYRVCSADPQGEPEEDNWAAMEGAFSQTFYVPAAVEGDFPSLSAEEEAAALAFGPLPASAMVVAGPVPAALSRLAMTDRVVVISALKCE